MFLKKPMAWPVAPTRRIFNFLDADVDDIINDSTYPGLSLLISVFARSTSPLGYDAHTGFNMKAPLALWASDAVEL